MKKTGNKYEIVITVDTNDADCVTQISQITEEQLIEIKPLIAAIKKFKPYKVESSWDGHNYPTGECLRLDSGEKSPRELYKFPEVLFELFEEFLPCCEHGFHTIDAVVICPRVKKERLL